MGFWSDLFGEPKHFSPLKQYSNVPETGQDAVKPERPSDSELSERFDNLCSLLDNDRNNVTWEGWEISASKASGRITVRKESMGIARLCVYKDKTMHRNSNRFYQNFGLATYEGFITKLEDLIANGTIKSEPSLEGKVMGLLLNLKPQLMISNDRAFLWTGSSLLLYNVNHDSDLNLKYVECTHMSTSAYSMDSVSWAELYEVVSKLELDKFEPSKVSIEEKWLDEFAQGQLRSRILRERKLSEWIQEIIQLHNRYNENAKKYEFATAGELNSYEAIMIFLHLIKKTNPEFSYEEITNYLLFKGMLKEGYERRCPNESAKDRLSNIQTKVMTDILITQRSLRNRHR